MNKVERAVWTRLLPRSPVFTTAELARAAGLGLPNASRDLATMADRGILTKVRRGLWAVRDHPEFSPEIVVPYLFEEGAQGYVSLLSALSLHGMISQIPQRVQVVTTLQRPLLPTPVATYEFHSMTPRLIGGHEPYGRLGRFELATPEKALFDTLYLSARRGRRFSHLPELELPAAFSAREIESWIERIDHRPLRRAVRVRWEASAAEAEGPPGRAQASRSTGRRRSPTRRGPSRA